MLLTEMLTMRPKRRSTMPGTTARIISSAEKKCTSSQPQPFLARQRAEIGRRLANAGIGDEDVGVGQAASDAPRPSAW